MGKRVLAIVVVIIVSIVGGILFLLSSSADNAAVSKTTSQTDILPSKPMSTGQMSNNSAGAAAESGVYVDYSSSIIADTPGTKLLFFHAPWCPQCRDLESDIKQKGVPSGVAIIKVDYDSNQSLRKKYGVTIQTTIVRIDDQGNAVKKYVAYDDPSLEAVKRNIL